MSSQDFMPMSVFNAFISNVIFFNRKKGIPCARHLAFLPEPQSLEIQSRFALALPLSSLSLINPTALLTVSFAPGAVGGAGAAEIKTPLNG